jgi:GNAT superfamily N-acetyltransferase
MSAVLPSGVVFEAASLTVERVGDVSGLDAWLEVRCASLGWGAATVGAWRSAHEHLGFAQDAAVLSYIARRQGEPVGCLTLHIGDAAYDGTTTAGIYHVDTVPSARRSGVATTLTLHAMMEAERRGAERVLLSATSVARGMYARLGYVESGHLTFWFDEALGF